VSRRHRNGRRCKPRRGYLLFQSHHWQRDLIISHVELAHVATADAPQKVAAEHCRQALAIARDLATSGRLAPADTWMVEELEQRVAAAAVS
jgi:hypothetical protein